MTGKKAVGTAAGLGAVAAVFFGVAHSCGALVDDAGRGVGRAYEPRPPAVAPKVPYVPPAVYDALTDPTVQSSVKEGISVFRQLRNGDDSERVVVKVACGGFDAFASEQMSQQQYEDYIASYATGQVSAAVINKYKSKLATGMYAAEINGGLLKWYVQYCVFAGR